MMHRIVLYCNIESKKSPVPFRPFTALVLASAYIFRPRPVQVRILRNLRHPNVIEIYQFYQDDPNNYFVVIEFMRGGELFDRIVRKVRAV